MWLFSSVCGFWETVKFFWFLNVFLFLRGEQGEGKGGGSFEEFQTRGKFSAPIFFWVEGFRVENGFFGVQGFRFWDPEMAMTLIAPIQIRLSQSSPWVFHSKFGQALSCQPLEPIQIKPIPVKTIQIRPGLSKPSQK